MCMQAQQITMAMDLPFLKEQQTSSNANKKSKTGA